MSPTRITVEPVRALNAGQELALVRGAHAARPTPALRARLARLLRGEPAALIALLGDAADLGPAEALLLAAARAQQAGGDAAAVGALGPALAGGPHWRSAALTLRARSERRAGRPAAARASLHEALALDPHNRDACARLVEVDAGDPDAVLALVRGLAAQGVAHAYLIAGEVAARARLGDAGARDLEGARFRGGEAVAPDIDPAALAAELLAHPDLRVARDGNRPDPALGIAAPLTREAPLLARLMARIAAALERRIAALAGDHPWLAMRPAAATLHCSCVMTGAAEEEHWHVHPTGWLNGIYYVRLPHGIAGGADAAGCIGFGLPPALAGEAAAAARGVDVVRPREGLMLTFPSHSFHRTFAHGRAGRRIGITFEVRPAR
jgi:hypothetical protein